MTGLTRSPDAFWPMNDHWVAHTAFIGVSLETLQRSVASPRPTPWVVVVGMLSADFVDVLEVFFKTLRNKVVEVLLVVASGRAAFC